MFDTLISYMSFMVLKMALNLPKSGFLTHKFQYQKNVRFFEHMMATEFIVYGPILKESLSYP